MLCVAARIVDVEVFENSVGDAVVLRGLDMQSAFVDAPEIAADADITFDTGAMDNRDIAENYTLVSESLTAEVAHEAHPALKPVFNENILGPVTDGNLNALGDQLIRR